MGGLLSALNPFTYTGSIDSTIERMIYYPPPTENYQFNTLNTCRSKFTVLKTNGLSVPIVVVNPKNNWNPTKYIVFSHGNASDIFTMFEYFEQLADACGAGVVGYDYVGYGLSRECTPTESNCYASMECCMNHVLNTLKIEPSNLYLVGQSLGTGMTIDYVSKHSWANPIILISPYKSICRVAYDTSLISSVDKFKSHDKLENILCPVKIFHGKADETINISHGYALYADLIDKSIEPTWFEGVGHNDILNYITPDHYLEVLNFII
jgi:pimeloyl-ACP methyl ester carboxylesterase